MWKGSEKTHYKITHQIWEEKNTTIYAKIQPNKATTSINRKDEYEDE
jgi:hypothetical protein